MDNPEPGRSSSSPSAKTYIDSVTYEGTGEGAVRVRLSDGSLFLLDPDAAGAATLAPGDLLDDDQIEILAAADETRRCRTKATDLLARAEQNRRGLAEKLRKRGFSPTAVAAAIDRLIEKGWLDDRRFADSWVRSRLRTRPEGPTVLVAGLMKRGVDGRTAREAVDQALGENGADDALDRAGEKLLRRSGITGPKLRSALARKGFRPGEIDRWLRDHDLDPFSAGDPYED